MIAASFEILGSNEVEHVVQLGPRDPQFSRLFARLREQFLDLPQAPFAKELVVPRGYEAALSLHGCDKSFGLQVGVRALGGYHADTEAVCERTDRGEFPPPLGSAPDRIWAFICEVICS